MENFSQLKIEVNLFDFLGYYFCLKLLAMKSKEMCIRMGDPVNARNPIVSLDLLSVITKNPAWNNSDRLVLART